MVILKHAEHTNNGYDFDDVENNEKYFLHKIHRFFNALYFCVLYKTPTYSVHI